ncbi:MAG: pentapeptide repeat-containing protein [Planctomycetota bacterium]|jgi:uncharacterized protein YjbI with pentapeptide repeats
MGKDPSTDILERLESDSFKGKRSHLVRLFAFLDFSDEWRRWRKRTGEVPDLRGANLGELDLGGIDLSHARLRGANLSGAIIRTGDLRHADLRDCELRHTDLSYANLCSAKLIGANLSHTLLTEADLSGADLRRSFLVGTSMNQANLKGADLRGAVVWGISTWTIQCDDTTQQDGLLVAPNFEPLELFISDDRAKDYRDLQDPEVTVRVDDIEVAHFISLLIENPMIGRVIDAASDKIVLLLGRFVGREKDVLNALKNKLPSFGYVPVVFDFPETENRDTIETVAILAGLSNFVIANLSRPRSTPLEAHLVIPAIAVPFVPIVREGERPFSMFTALQRKYPWVLPTVTYRDEENLLRRLKRTVIEPAERAAAALRRSKHPREKSAR